MVGLRVEGDNADEVLILVTEGGQGLHFRGSPLAVESKDYKTKLDKRSEIVRFKLIEDSDVLEEPNVERLSCIKVMCGPLETPKLGKLKWINRTLRLKVEAERAKLMGLMGLLKDKRPPPWYN